MTRKRRTYTKEFKIEAVKLVTEEGYRLAEAAENLGIHANLLSTWKRKYGTEQGTTHNGDLNGEERKELRRLREENRRLRMERDILKKATVYFAKESQ